MGLDIDKMKEVMRKQDAAMRAQEAAIDSYNTAIDEFDALVKECPYYRPAKCHGEDDPECDQPNNEVKWCEALECPLLK